MRADFGVLVGSRFRESPLCKQSPLAVKIWLVLASMAAHTAVRREIAGRWVEIEAGEVLIAMRTLARAVRCGVAQLRRELGHLALAGAVEIALVEAPSTCPSRTRQRVHSGYVQRVGNRHGVRVLLTRIKVNGFKALARNVNVSGLDTQDKSVRPVLSKRERDQNARAIAILEAEGR